MFKKLLSLLSLGLLLSSQAYALGDVADPWLVRLRGIWVKPEASSTRITTIGGNVNQISSTVVPEIDFSYFLTNNVALELILAASRHHPVANNTAVGQVDLGKVTVWPATLSVQYHLNETNGLKPYVGVGVNYSLYSNVNSGPTATSIKYKSRVGAGLDIGTDYRINDNWWFNVDLKKLFFKSKATVRALGTTVRSTVSINPWVLGVGIGYRA